MISIEECIVWKHSLNCNDNQTKPLKRIAQSCHESLCAQIVQASETLFYASKQGTLTHMRGFTEKRLKFYGIKFYEETASVQLHIRDLLYNVVYYFTALLEYIKF